MVGRGVLISITTVRRAIDSDPQAAHLRGFSSRGVEPREERRGAAARLHALEQGARPRREGWYEQHPHGDHAADRANGDAVAARACARGGGTGWGDGGEGKHTRV